MITIDAKTSMVSTALRRASGRLRDATPILKLVGLEVVNAVRRRFKESKSPKGETWKALAPATIANRRNRNKGSIKPLVDTGRLRNSVTFDVRSGREVAIGTTVIYAPTHHFGRGRIPARPFMGVTNAEENQLVRRIQGWTVRQLREAGL